MVWKSKRWESLLSKADGEGFLVEDTTAPQPLEISYFRPDAGEEVEELVYEDRTDNGPKQKEDDDLPARLLVPLSNVLKLKELCEHEHARSDDILGILSVCRSDYMKELCWLREQLHLLRNHAEHRDLPEEHFEVRWFEPPKYLEPELKEFLMDCITKNVRPLWKDIEALRDQVANLERREKELLGDPSPKALLRRILEGNKPGFIVTELNSMMRTQEDVSDLQRAAHEILIDSYVPQKRRQAEPEVVVKKEIVQDPALLEEVEYLRKKSLMDDQMVKQLRESLEEGLEKRMDLDMEKERAEAEKSRADAQEKRANEEQQRKEEAEHLAHKEKRRAEELAAKCEKLQMELANGSNGKGRGDVARKVRQSVMNLGSVIESLKGTSAKTLAMPSSFQRLSSTVSSASAGPKLGMINESFGSGTTSERSNQGAHERSQSVAISDPTLATDLITSASNIDTIASSINAIVHGGSNQGPDKGAISDEAVAANLLTSASSLNAIASNIDTMVRKGSMIGASEGDKSSGMAVGAFSFSGVEAMTSVPKLDQDDECNLDDDVAALTSLAAFLSEAVPKAVGELHTLQSEHNTLARGQEDFEARLAEQAKELEAAKAAARAAEGKLDFDAQLQEAQKETLAELRELQAKSSNLEAQLEQERTKFAEMQATFDELETANIKMGERMEHYKQKAEEAKKKLRALRQPGEESSDSDDDFDYDDEDEWKFLISYTRRAKKLSAIGKRRWEMLSEDADLAKKKREYLMSMRRSTKWDAEEHQQMMAIAQQEETPDVLQMLVRHTVDESQSPNASSVLLSRQQDETPSTLKLALTAGRQQDQTPNAPKMSLTAGRHPDQSAHAPRVSFSAGRQQDQSPNAPKMVAVRQQDESRDGLKMVSSQQKEQVKAAFSFLTASRSASSMFQHSSRASLAEMPSLGALQRQRPSLESLAMLPVATDMWPHNASAVSRGVPSLSNVKSQAEPIEIKLLGKAAEKPISLTASAQTERTVAAPAQESTYDAGHSDVELQNLPHRIDSKHDRLSTCEEEGSTQLESPPPPPYQGPLSPGLVNKLWSSSTSPVEESPPHGSQGVSSSSPPPLARTAPAELIAAAAPSQVSAQKYGNPEMLPKALDASFRSALSDTRQGQEQSRRIFQNTWHGALQKGSSSSGHPASHPSAAKTPSGDSLPELLSVDRPTPVKSRLPSASRTSDERQSTRSRSANKLSRTGGWPSAEKRKPPSWPTRVPLTNAARANHHYASAPELQVRYRATIPTASDAFLPEVLPPLPAGRQLKMERHYLPGLPS